MGDAEIDLEDEVRELFKRKLSEFATFCAHEWQLPAEDHADAFPGKSEDHRQGFNDAMRGGVQGAIECWAEPMGYT